MALLNLTKDFIIKLKEAINNFRTHFNLFITKYFPPLLSIPS